MKIQPLIVALLAGIGSLSERAASALVFDKPVVVLTNVATPSISADGLSLYFARIVGPGDVDLFVANRPALDAEWGPAISLGTNINRPRVYDGYPKISANGLELYFMDSGPFTTQLRPGGLGGGDIWVSKRDSTTNTWNKPVNAGAPVNSAHDEYYPCPSFDSLSLYFTSTRPGGRGGSGDIWVATRPTLQDRWQDAMPLGPPVNSPAWEGAPMVSSNGLVLLFYSDRAGSMSSLDLWMTTRLTTTNSWQTPTHLSAPFNSPFYDNSPTFSADFPAPGSKLYFSQNNAAGFGGEYTLYAATVLPEIPLKITSALLLDRARLLLTWMSVPGGRYQLAFATNLPATNWQCIGTNLTATGSTANLIIEASHNIPQGFYRIVQLAGQP